MEQVAVGLQLVSHRDFQAGFQTDASSWLAHTLEITWVTPFRLVEGAMERVIFWKPTFKVEEVTFNRILVRI